MPKGDFKIALRHEYSSVNLQHIFRTSFSKNTSGWLLLTRLNRSNHSVHQIERQALSKFLT